jgi:V/A-type H+-transporting ATPase subunit D
MPGRVSPTRMKLLETKKHYSVATKGHKLLKEKLEALVRELIIFTRELEEKEKIVSKKLPPFFDRFIRFRATVSEKEIQEILASFSVKLCVDMSYRNVMNISLPIFQITIEEKENPNFSGKGISPLFDIVYLEFRELISEILKLAEIESSIYALAKIIELTRRRVNALEYVLIPELEKTIKDITSKLDENERSNIVRLMKIKEILSSKS